MTEDEHNDGLALSLTNIRQVRIDRDIFSCKLQGAACDLLKEISSLDLYVQPLNKLTRGESGSSSTLLSSAKLWARPFDPAMFWEFSTRPASVLLRVCELRVQVQQFTPGDAMFANHRDTPYFDRKRSHVSKYTVLIYLTSGRNESVLRVGDVKFDEIEEMTCVIFHQIEEHGGRPFIEGNKLFIRSELVFEDTDLHPNIEIATLFSQACYMTGQSVLDDGLASYAHDCFERAKLTALGDRETEASAAAS